MLSLLNTSRELSFVYQKNRRWQFNNLRQETDQVRISLLRMTSPSASLRDRVKTALFVSFSGAYLKNVFVLSVLACLRPDDA